LTAKHTTGSIAFSASTAVWPGRIPLAAIHGKLCAAWWTGPRYIRCPYFRLHSVRTDWFQHGHEKRL